MASEVKCEVIINDSLEVYNIAIDSVINWLMLKKWWKYPIFENDQKWCKLFGLETIKVTNTNF